MRVVRRAKGIGGRIAVCLVAAAAVSAISGTGLAAASTGYHETFTQTIDAGHSLNAVSCVPATTECVAADSKGDAFYATNTSATSGATWNAWGGPGVSPSHAVECASATLCLLAAGEVNGGGGNLYRSDSLGGSFLTSFKPGNGVGAISCPSTSFCVSAAEGGGFIRYATDPSGILWKAVAIGSGAMKDVSCLSTFCTVVDGSGNVRVATTEEGVTEAPGWTASNVNSEAALQGVACSSTSSCVAIDGSDEVLNLTIGLSGEATASRQGIDGADELIAVDCMGATCAAVDDNGGIFASTNGGADWIVRHSGGAGLTSVSCASASLCAAVTTAGDVTTFNPATTTPPLTITSSSLPGGDAGAPYEAEVQATGGEPPYEWSANGLPPGLSIDPVSGEISGTLANVLCVGGPCEYPAMFTVTDDNGTQASAPLTIALAVNAYALKVTTGGTGFGEVDSSPAGIDECGTAAGSCEAPYENGTVVTLTAKPAADSTFAGWSGSGCSGTGSCQVAMDAEADVSATFAKVSPPDGDGSEKKDPPPSEPQPDVTPPKLWGLQLAPRRLIVGKRGRASVLSYRLSEAARMRFVVQRGLRGVRVRARGKVRCAKPNRRTRRLLRRKARRCVRWRGAGVLRRAGRPGLNRLRLTGRFGRRVLPPGHYRIVARAFDSAGKRSQVRARGFHVVRRR